MATLIPSFNQCTWETGGERRLADRLVEFSEGTLCWYDVPIGLAQRQPDFILLHPRKGLLVLEVKDWVVDSIAALNPKHVTVRTSEGEKSVENPVVSARHYAISVIEELKRDRALVHADGDYRGHLSFPWGWGVVLPNISRRQFNQNGLGAAILDELVICRDEMIPRVPHQELERRVWSMLQRKFPAELSEAQVDRIRWRIFPDVRIPAKQGELFASSEAPDVMKVMDVKQEQLARSLRSGHRVIHGVAGSGKTVILLQRVAHLARAASRRMLVVTYNESLALWLRTALVARGVGDKVEVTTFHKWCRSQLGAHRLQLPPECDDKGAFYDGLVSRTIEGVRSGHIPGEQYSAVFIDEGHDFDAEWLKVLVQMVEPKSKSLLIAYDDAQAIYASARGSRRFSFKSVGIEAAGRTTVLRKNYRNTDQILLFASKIADRILKPADASADEIPVLVPVGAGRQGPEPRVKQFADPLKEARFVVDSLKAAHRNQISWREMAVVYPTRAVGETVERFMNSFGIPAVNFRDATFAADEDKVLVVTMHSCKGLEFPYVAIVGADRINSKDPTEKTRLLYVAMTRATRELVVTSRGPLT